MDDGMTGPPAIRIEIKKSFFFFLRPRCRVIVSPRAKVDGRFDRSKEEKENETRPTSTASFVLPARARWRHGNSAVPQHVPLNLSCENNSPFAPLITVISNENVAHRPDPSGRTSLADNSAAAPPPTRVAPSNFVHHQFVVLSWQQ